MSGTVYNSSEQLGQLVTEVLNVANRVVLFLITIYLAKLLLSFCTLRTTSSLPPPAPPLEHAFTSLSLYLPNNLLTYLLWENTVFLLHSCRFQRLLRISNAFLSLSC